MTPPEVVDTRPLFAPLHAELLALLRALAPADWDKPTLAREWAVRDVVAHMLDGTLRRLSFQRDGLPLVAPAAPVEGFRGLVALLDRLNAEWVRAARRLSPRLLIDLHALAGAQLAAFFESLDPLAPAFFPVAWAGADESAAWMDVGRDYTELWHHQQQVREAVGAPLLVQPRWLQPLLSLALRALPRAYAALEAEPGTAVEVRIGGASGGAWALVRDTSRWRVWVGSPEKPRARVALDEDAAWRLFFKALAREEAARRVTRAGEAHLADAFLDARAVMA